VRGQRHAPAAFTLGKDPVFILQEAGWAPEPVWTGAKNLAPPLGFDPRTVQPVANRENMSAQNLKRGNFKSRKYLLSYLLYARKSERRCEACVVIRIRPNLVLINLKRFIPLCCFRKYQQISVKQRSLFVKNPNAATSSVEHSAILFVRSYTT